MSAALGSKSYVFGGSAQIAVEFGAVEQFLAPCIA